MGISLQEQYNELLYYTLGHPDMTYFIHQHVVDAFSAQNADKDIKPISITFSLAGLYLYIEKKYSGRQVQLAHIRMSKNKKAWPKINLPEQRGEINIADVLNALPGEERDRMIKRWSVSVWQAYKESHEIVVALVKRELGLNE